MNAIVLALILAFATMQSTCPMTIGVGRDGTLFSDRFYGWYKTTPKTLESDLRGGCYNDNNPHAVTSVTLALAPGASQSKVDLVFSILGREGWSRGKVTTESWSGYPQKPR